MNKYQRQINGAVCDVYDVLKAFGVACPATQHAIKKLLCPGTRGHKDQAQDLREALLSIQRAIELTGGDAAKESNQAKAIAKTYTAAEAIYYCREASRANKHLEAHDIYGHRHWIGWHGLLSTNGPRMAFGESSGPYIFLHAQPTHQ